MNQVTTSIFEDQLCAECQYSIDNTGLCVLDASHKAGAVVHCSTCDNREELGGELTAQALIDDGWLLEPVVWCPLHGPDDEW